MEEKNKKNEEQTYEKTSLKDYKFTIILLCVIAVFALGSPLLYKGVQWLDETNFFDNLFSKNNSNNNNNANNQGNNNDSNKKTNADKSGANEPVLKDGMIPVRYNQITKKWVKANSKNPSTNTWYNYENKEWANAILVKENGINSREYYMNANPDTEINNEDILAFYVWIPRYKYSLVSNTGNQQIDIIFEDKNAQKTTGPNYITHPAFTFGNEELAGIWVGKFEITGNIYNLSVLPNISPIVNQDIVTMYNLIQSMYGNYYGLTNSDTNLHLMKNTEWGAVTYLTNSKYGICKNNVCSDMTPYNYDYDSDAGVNSSTTKNINGVYAMNSNVMEYVMGNNNGNVGLSGFDQVWMSENKKYYDTYADGEATDYSRGISGDATTEFGPFQNNLSVWKSSYSVFVDSSSPWFVRDINSSIYSFGSYTGGQHNGIGFRLSLY